MKTESHTLYEDELVELEMSIDKITKAVEGLRDAEPTVRAHAIGTISAHSFSVKSICNSIRRLPAERRVVL